MKLLKPHWVHHDDKPIFSLDIHPDGTKFATGGQGNDSGRVVIWNLAPLLSEKAEMDKTVPKILCQLDNHLACVNCVRWSLNGQMLASGGDDKVVMIWKCVKGSSGVFGSSGFTKSIENWRCANTLRGHAGDVLDLAWSPQDRWLGSCSVDNSVIIWDVFAMPAIVAILKGHTGLVKGITWDPVGKFVASQSDDRSIKIWKTADWTCQSTITEPFEECGGTTHILRLSWSPDGQYLVSAHAMNGGGPTAQIIEREGWKCDKDFVGHRKAVTCVRFHNSIMKRTTPKTNKSQQYCCLSVGSRDKSLSIWMTALQRPLLVIHDLFQDSVLDLSWSTDGYILMACSGDGTVACLQFSPNELGTPLSEEDKNALYQRMYGKSASDMNAQSQKDMIIENADLLTTLIDKPKPPSFIVEIERQQTAYQNRPDLAINHKSLESVNNNSNSQLSSIQQPSSPSPTKQAIHKQIETRTADGKRRITPMFIPMNQDVGDSTPTGEFSSSSRTGKNIMIEKNDTPITANNVIPSSPQINDEVSKAIEIRQLDNRLTKSSTGNALPPVKTSSSLVKGVASDSTGNQTTAKSDTANSRMPMLTAGRPEVLHGNAIKTTGEFRVQVLNGAVEAALGNLSKVLCVNFTSPDNKLWEIYVGSPIVNFNICSKYVLICSADGTVRFLNIQTGILVIPVINMPTAVVQSAFNLNSQFGGVLSECGQIRIWNISEQSVVLSSSCTDLLKGGTALMLTITENGIPFVLTSNGCSYCYSKKLESWLVLNSRDPITQQSISGCIKSPIQKNMRTYPLMSVQSTAHSMHPKSRNFLDVSPNVWEQASRLSFIENQILLSESINSPEELKYWYSMLGFHLAHHGTEKRLRLLLDQLLGSVYGRSSVRTNHQILGIDKHILLANVLKQLLTQPQWHRIYMEYSEQLKSLQQP